MATLATITAAGYLVTAEGDAGPFTVTLSAERAAEGLDFVTISMSAPAPARPAPIRISWLHPMVATHLRWSPDCGTDRTVLPEWRASRICHAKNTLNAPVYALMSSDGRNALTFALSDARNPSTTAAGVNEETACARCEVTLFTEEHPPTALYEATIRLDTRPLPWHRALAQVAEWWDKLPGYEPSAVPEHARLPMYSSWYAFHQHLEPRALERECRLAKGLGMESVIVDDGWQTEDVSRGYAFCGDWEAAESKFGDFPAHVARVHDTGMKYILWFSVPYVGERSKAWPRFKDRILDPTAREPWHVLDPRFPEVRENLIETYERFVGEYDVDGFKLDFVDTFGLREETRETAGGGRDIDSVPEAVDRLLTDTMARLRRMKADILVEFRQQYVGPLMRKYGNMFRAGDVPDDYHGNRISTVDIRLLSGGTPAHSDMVMWHPDEPVESAAMQLLHTLFAVPQVSVMLDGLGEDHVRMIRWYLSFWRRHRDVLLDGAFEPQGPGALYPVVRAESDGQLIAAVYADSPVVLSAAAAPSVVLVNGTFRDRVIVETPEDAGRRRLSVTDCMGGEVAQGAVNLTAGVHAITVPPAGTARLDE